MSPRWFELIRHCIAECRRLGLVPALYDEHSYPSGFAGGHVPARSPQTASHHVIPKFGKLPGQPPADALAVYRTENGIPVEKLPVGDLPAGSSWCAFVIERMHPMPWHGEFPYTSLLDPQTTEAFLETTYRRYRDELGDDWKACAAFFTDEPHLTSDGHGPWAQGQHFTRLVQAEFRRRRGYPVEDVLADLYFDSATSSANIRNYEKPRGTIERSPLNSDVGNGKGWGNRAYDETIAAEGTAAREVLLDFIEGRIPDEELFSIEDDPGCMKNLLPDPAYATKLAELRKAESEWAKITDDRTSRKELEEKFPKPFGKLKKDSEGKE